MLSSYFGYRMTQSLQKKILPQLRWNQEMYGETVLRQLQAKASDWLDIGCGHRVLPADLEQLEDRMIAISRSVKGCDVDEEAMGHHRSIRQLYRGDITSLPFDSNSLDLVTCNMVCEHLENPETGFQEVARVLRPGGIFVVHTPNLWNYLVLTKHMVSKVIPNKLLMRFVSLMEGRAECDIYPTFYRANTINRLTELGKDAGLIVRESKTLVAPQPFFKSIAPVAGIQLLLMRAMLNKRFRKYGQTIVMVFEKE